MPKRHHVLLGLFVLVVLLVAYHTAASEFPFRAAIKQQHLSSHQYLDIQNTGDRLVAVGERGLIIYSDDDGTSWQQARVPVSLTLTALHFPTSKHGWAVGHGGVILHSGDAGESWHTQFDGNDVNKAWQAYTQSEWQLQREALQKLEQAGVTGAQLREQQLKTEDAQYAAEDAEQAVATGPNDPFLDVLFTDENHGIAIGAYGMIYRTTNGGLNWRLTAASAVNADRYHLYSIAAGDNNQLFISGELGTLLKSVDNGEHWQQLESPYDGSLYGIQVIADQRLLSFGLRGNLLTSDDYGLSWTSVKADNSASLFASLLLPNNTLLLCGAAGALLSTTDNAQTFTSNHHSSRSVFSAIASTGSGELIVTGLDGLTRISNARSADND